MYSRLGRELQDYGDNDKIQNNMYENIGNFMTGSGWEWKDEKENENVSRKWKC